MRPVCTGSLRLWNNNEARAEEATVNYSTFSLVDRHSNGSCHLMPVSDTPWQATWRFPRQCGHMS